MNKPINNYILAFSIMLLCAMSCQPKSSNELETKSDTTKTDTSTNIVTQQTPPTASDTVTKSKPKTKGKAGSKLATSLYRKDSSCSCNDFSPATLDGEMLHYICDYIEENNFNTTVQACTITISKKETVTRKGKEVYEIGLSNGDVVVMDKKTLQILSYTPGNQ